MATFQTSAIFSLMGSFDNHIRCFPKRVTIKATRNGNNNAPNFQVSPISLPKLPTRNLVENLDFTNSNDYKTPNTARNETHYFNSPIDTKNASNCNDDHDPMVTSKLYAIMEAVADRVEMHNNVGVQRDNWNRLLLASINSITLTAATMTGLAATTLFTCNANFLNFSPAFLALKLSSTILYIAATGMSVMMNRIQPSQLAEEQRNAARLFKQLHGQVQATLSLIHRGYDSNVITNILDVDEAIERVLALDRAYPLPLLGEMLDKFPKIVQPTIWWPKQRNQGHEGKIPDAGNNGWSEKLEDEMREIARVLESKDVPEYLRLAEKALKVNRVLAICGPILTGFAALGSALVGSTSNYGVWGVMFGVICGALACVVNTIEHGGQVGMVVEMYRSNAGFFRLMQENIESNLKEKQFERRENGEVIEIKVALQLGRSLSELKHFAIFSEKFASKLF